MPAGLDRETLEAGLDALGHFAKAHLSDATVRALDEKNESWAGIGMASRGSIPKMMEVAGIDMLDPAIGIPLIRRELTAGGTRGEIVVAGRLGVLLDGDRAIGRMSASLPPNHAPVSAPTISGPRLCELIFQTAGIWEMRASGRLALPLRVGRVEVLGDVKDGAVLHAVTRSRNGAFDAAVFDEVGRVVIAVSDYRTVALPSGAATQN